MVDQSIEEQMVSRKKGNIYQLQCNTQKKGEFIIAWQKIKANGHASLRSLVKISTNSISPNFPKKYRHWRRGKVWKRAQNCSKAAVFFALHLLFSWRLLTVFYLKYQMQNFKAPKKWRPSWFLNHSNIALFMNKSTIFCAKIKILC